MINILYAKAGGPPNNWNNLDIYFNDKLSTENNWVEVNVEEGWGRKFKLGDDNKPIPNFKTGEVEMEMITGTFIIKEKE